MPRGPVGVGRTETGIFACAIPPLSSAGRRTSEPMHSFLPKAPRRYTYRRGAFFTIPRPYSRIRLQTAPCGICRCYVPSTTIRTSVSQARTTDWKESFRTPKPNCAHSGLTGGHRMKLIDSIFPKTIAPDAHHPICPLAYFIKNADKLQPRQTKTKTSNNLLTII